MKKETSVRALICRVLMLLYIFAVAYLCFNNFHNLPDVPKQFLDIPIDKVVHFCMFFPFPILGFFSFDHKKWSKVKTLGVILEVCSYGIIFAGLTELVQSFLPYRTQDVMDFKADVTAVFLSSVIVLAIELVLRKRNGK